jgi:hypothetical protein
MLAQWRQTHNSTEQAEGAEIGLTAFTGICYNCQSTGHGAKDADEEVVEAETGKVEAVARNIATTVAK